MGAVLITERLTRRFGGVVALKGVSLDIPSGERHAIIGPNGAGKTTLFNLISGELSPSSGRVLLDARPITGLPPHRIAAWGLARTFQRNNLLLNLSALENVRLAVQAHTPATRRLLTPATRLRGLLDDAHALLARVGLESSAPLPARALSYGEQRQLEIGIALAGRPRILLLDEPTSGMSPAETANMTRLIAHLEREQTIVLIEHDMDVVFAIADRITVLHLGEVLAVGTPGQVKAHPRVQEVYLGAPPASGA
ncbi:MAG TPA: ABC transporter ATP-binding protein [bacterium]|nr:ABC transporter ATP-binding protein [bacterium]